MEDFTRHTLVEMTMTMQYGCANTIDGTNDTSLSDRCCIGCIFTSINMKADGERVHCIKVRQSARAMNWILAALIAALVLLTIGKCTYNSSTQLFSNEMKYFIMIQFIRLLWDTGTCGLMQHKRTQVSLRWLRWLVQQKHLQRQRNLQQRRLPGPSITFGGGSRSLLSLVNQWPSRYERHMNQQH